ncbi:TetR/AcrR family transcriptional regulator [Oenococcus sp. UCMA 16435]|nr:TetR/AcrR family transcriptional regulator [Oenococcus sp. UCMA 16435]MDI4584627.1 TetR family transcriptional regulator [Oenococcus sp. UCMA 14587]
MSEEADSLRERLITVARTLFVTKGYNATTTREINAVAGTAGGLLYYYFPHGKRQLLDTIIRDGVAGRMAKVQIQLNQASDVSGIEAALMKTFDQIWIVFSAEASYQSFIITIRERALLSAEQSGWLAKLLNKIVVQLTNELATVRSILPGLKKSDCVTFARMILALFQKSLYDELLIANHRQPSAETRVQVKASLHLLLGMAIR